mgnify:CR=1 FL=1
MSSPTKAAPAPAPAFVVSLIGCFGASDSVRTSVSNRVPSTRISLNAGGVARTRLESVPAPISRSFQPLRS